MEPQKFEEKYLSRLTTAQRRAVVTAKGPVLLLAVPGSGKTTVLVHRLGYLLHCCGVPPSKILTVTYTRAAAEDMGQRFEERFPEFRGAGLRFATINALAVEIIGEYSRNFSRKPPFQTAETTVTRGILREIYSATAEEYLTPGLLRQLETHISYVKNMMLNDQQIQELQTEIPGFADIYAAYQETLRKNRQMDFDDQLVYAHRILASQPGVLAVFQERYGYFCVDEAQDTSLLQHVILRQLAAKTRNLFMVGDEDQSIYGFRAAYPQALTDFESVYPEGKILYIQQNFRSTPEIVRAADRFVGKNLCRYPKQLTAVRQTGEPVEIITLPGQREELLFLRWVVKNARRQTAVLYRNQECCVPLLDYLERQGIPYRYPNGENSFFTGRAATDVANLIRFADDPTDTQLFLAVYSRLPLYLKREQAKYLCAAKERTGKGMLAILAEDTRLSAERRGAVRRCMKNLERLNSLSALEALTLICNELGYTAYLERNGSGIGALTALNWLAKEEPTAKRLVERLKELEAALKNHRNAPDSKVVLSTIHSAKGLEYEEVYLLDVVDGILPQQNPEDVEGTAESPDYQEERRLFYVAMTRAQNCLHLFYRMNVTSTFVEEVNADLPRETGSPRHRLNGEYDHAGLGRVRLLGWGRNRCLVKDGAGNCLVVPEDGQLREIPRRLNQKQSLSSHRTVTEPDDRAGTPLVLTKGDRVEHIVFGTGTVEQVTERMVTIYFDNGITKLFSILILGSIGALKIISESNGSK